MAGVSMRASRHTINRLRLADFWYTVFSCHATTCVCRYERGDAESILTKEMPANMRNAPPVVNACAILRNEKNDETEESTGRGKQGNKLENRGKRSKAAHTPWDSLQQQTDASGGSRCSL